MAFPQHMASVMDTQILSRTHIIIPDQGLDQEETKIETIRGKAVATVITARRTIIQILHLNLMRVLHLRRLRQYVLG
jgi:hypothetical protein